MRAEATAPVVYAPSTSQTQDQSREHTGARQAECPPPESFGAYKVWTGDIWAGARPRWLFWISAHFAAPAASRASIFAAGEHPKVVQEHTPGVFLALGRSLGWMTGTRPSWRSSPPTPISLTRRGSAGRLASTSTRAHLAKAGAAKLRVRASSATWFADATKDPKTAELPKGGSAFCWSPSSGYKLSRGGTRPMSIGFSRHLWVAAALIGLVWTAVASAQTPRLRSGTIGKFAGVDQSNSVCTTSFTSVNMPDMARTFTISGTSSRSVVVLFQGSNWAANAQRQVEIQLTIDGVPNPGPGGSIVLPVFQGDEDAQAPFAVSHGFNFQTDALAPGSHTARIRWRSFDGSTVCVGPRSMIVLFK